MKRFATLLFAVAIGSATQASTITFDAMKAAAIRIPPHITSIAIIDRSISEDSHTGIIDGVLTGSGEEQLASQRILDGLAATFERSPRFKVIRTREALRVSSLGGKMPQPLSWAQIRAFCEKYEVDAVLSLEAFDSEFTVSDANRKTGDGQFKFIAEALATVNVGFRLYDPVEKDIIDQQQHEDRRSWQASGSSAEEALSALIVENEAVQQVGYATGKWYARRIAPTRIKISRDYFFRPKKKDHLAKGVHLMQEKNWDGAIAALERAGVSGSKKSRAMAAHNLAVVYEVLGMLDNAKEWAERAWGKYKHEPSKDYGYVLACRIAERRALDRQLGMTITKR